MNDAHFHSKIAFPLFPNRNIWNKVYKSSGEKPVSVIYICKSSNTFLSDHWKHINCFLGNKLFPKKTLKWAEIHQHSNTAKCEHLFGSEMKHWVIFYGIHWCQVASYLVEQSNLKTYQYFFKHWMIYYSSVKSSGTENCSIKFNVNSASEIKRNMFAVSIPNKM